MKSKEQLAEIVHELKTWPPYFEEVLNGNKTFEVRKNDRGFKVGDTLVLKEWNPNGYSSVSPNEMTGAYTGREVKRQISYILEGGYRPYFGLHHDYDILGLKPLSGFDAAEGCDKEKLANDLLIEIIKKDPVKMLQFYTLYLGKELVKSNAETMDLTQECDVENKRYKVSVTATISPLPQPPNQ